jgi:hypothetical protein
MLAMLSESPQIVASNLRFVECSDNLRARHKPILVKQTQARDESESFAKLGAFGHSRPRTFRGDLPIQHDCTDISAIDYEIGSKYLKTLGNLCRIVLLIRAQLQVAGSWFLPADFANPAKRPDVGANATPDQMQRLAVTISLGDKCAFNISNRIHFALIRSKSIRFQFPQLTLITENDIWATKRNCATEITCKACANRVIRGRQQRLTADLDINQYLFQIIENKIFLRGWFVWRGE